MRFITSKLAIGVIALGGVLAIGFQLRYLGVAVLLLCASWLYFQPIKRLRNDLWLVICSLLLLSVTPVSTDISPSHIAIMSVLLSATVLVPYYISRYYLGDHAVRFPLHHGRRWYRHEIGYIVLTAAIAYLLLPYALLSNGVYLNWPNASTPTQLGLLFLGTNALGIWDELFFVSTLLALFRRHVGFWYANIAQALLWVAFLYELGFRSWLPLVLFPFALLQGYIFRRTSSLLYILTIHLTLDLVLYLALVNAYHPEWFNFFLLRP